MATDILDLWGDSIKANVLTPLVILKMQAELLRRKSKGIVLGDISAQPHTNVQRYYFDLLAPAVGARRIRVLIASHSIDLVYPVVVEAIPLWHYDDSLSRTDLPDWFDAESAWECDKTASTEESFVVMLRHVLRSREVTSMIQSLIAISNE